MTDLFDDLVFEAEETETKPDSRAIEETLLVGLLSPTVAPHILEKTRSGDYQFQEHRDLAALIYPMAGEGRHIDPVTFRAALEEQHGETFVDNSLSDPKDPLRKLYDLAGDVMTKAKAAPPPDGQVFAYLDIFANQAKRRQARQLVATAQAAFDKGELSPEALAGEVFRAVSNLEASQRLAGTAKTEGEELEAFFAALEAQQSPTNDFQGLDTGFSHLNRVINGLSAGLIVLGAMPSTGKTTLIKQIADKVVEKHADAACLFVSLEQSKEELRVKTLSRLSGVENRDIQRGRLDPMLPAWQNVITTKGDFSQWAGRMQVLEGDRLTTVDRIRLAALQLRQKTGAGRLLIVVDYLQILPVDQDFGDIRQKVNFVTSELRRIGRDLDAPVIAIASINRASYSKSQGDLDAFKESGDIEFSADVALMLVDDKEKKAGSDNYLGIQRRWKTVFLDVVKNRNGEKARVELRFYPEVSYFAEVQKVSLPSTP